MCWGWVGRPRNCGVSWLTKRMNGDREEQSSRRVVGRPDVSPPQARISTLPRYIWRMSSTFSLLLAASLLSFAPSKNAPPIDYSVAYAECTKAIHIGVEQALAKCEQPALAGVPGAQYAMGALLTNRNSGNDMTIGIGWLEKAISAGSPAAAYHLSTVLLQRKDEASISRGRELFRVAVCAGYPAAVDALTETGGSTKVMPCPPSHDTDFSGEWSVSLKWDKAAPAGVTSESYRIAIA